MNTETDNYLSTKQAAAYLGVSDRRIWSMTHKGSLPTYKLGKTNLYKRSDLDALVEPRA